MFPAVENLVSILMLYIGVSSKEATKIFQVECNLLFIELIILNSTLVLGPFFSEMALGVNDLEDGNPPIPSSTI